mgnify:CR=1 FL=1|jgi:transposase-like protein/IS1 family transposase
MDTNDFASLMKSVPGLSESQMKALYKKLQGFVETNLTSSEPVIKELRETKFKEGFICPHCNSKHVVRYGMNKGRQRYKCKDCGKTSIDLTNTPLCRTRYPQKWILFIECMLNGFSLRKSATIVGVTWVTLFYWRHKILSALKQMTLDEFVGIVEVDETYFLQSEKGNKHIKGRKPRKRGGASQFRGISKEQVCVLVARDRSKNTVAKVTCMGRIMKPQLDKVIGNLISDKNILCTDAWRAYKTYATTKGITHYRIKSDGDSHTIKGIYHIQNVNSYHGRFKQWLYRFNGVSSKYMDNYLAWYKFLDSRGCEITKKNLKDMLVTACQFQVKETYNSLRLSKFAV